MHGKHKYKNREKLLAIKSRQRKKYYGRTPNNHRCIRYTKSEDELIINSKLPDFELAKKLNRTIRSIQIRRTKLRKMGHDIPYKGDYKGGKMNDKIFRTNITEHILSRIQLTDAYCKSDGNLLKAELVTPYVDDFTAVGHTNIKCIGKNRSTGVQQTTVGGGENLKINIPQNPDNTNAV